MEPGQVQVTVRRRLRPLRLAFLVDPSEEGVLRRIFQINTATWGGMHNLIVPAFRRLPTWWNRDDPKKQSALEVIRGYLRFFQPDYLVTSDQSMQPKIDFPSERVHSIAEVLSSDDSVGSFGLPAWDLYEHLYRTEYQFERRHPRTVALPRAGDNKLGLLGACLWGEFPPEYPELPPIFNSMFSADEFSVDEASFADLLRRQSLGPLQLGSAGLDVRAGGPLWEPTIMVMDGTRPIDLIDYWNLRAVGWPITPAPVQWLGSATEIYGRMVRRNYRPYGPNPEIKIRTILQRGRSVSMTDVERLAGELVKAQPDGIVLRSWYPRLWAESPPGVVELRPGRVTAASDTIELRAEGSSLRFPALDPGFARGAGSGLRPRWVNVVHVDESGFSPAFGLVMPRGLNIKALFGAFGPDEVWISLEGITWACHYPGWSTYWSMPTSLQLFISWAASRGFTLELSSAGRMATQVIKAIEFGQALINEDILRLINSMAAGGAGNADGGQQTRPSAAGREVRVGEWMERLKAIYDGDAERARSHLGYLVQHRVLQVGLRLQCPACTQASWYSLAQLEEQLTCPRCLEVLDFPAVDPPRDAWHYRAIGPFSVGDYAQGAYCVALARRFLALVLHGHQSWIPSFSLTSPQGDVLEADFGCFWKGRGQDDVEPQLVLGECKSYGQFAPKDVARARRLRGTFPEAIIAFCTLRSELSQQEKRRLRRLVRAGGKNPKPSPILILTGTELRSDTFGPMAEWRRRGGRYALIAEKYQNRYFGEVQAVAQATQDLYLGED